MPDKVQLIKQEIEKRINLLQNGDADPEVMKRVEGVLLAYNSILEFINSIPEESGCEVNFTTKNEDLEEEIQRFVKSYSKMVIGVGETARHFAKWGRNHFEDRSEMVSKDLEEAAINAWNKYSGLELMHIEEVVAFFKEAAEWQKQKDFEELLKSDMNQFKKCYEKGRFDMREEMMKDAVDGEVVYQIGSAEIASTDIRYKVVSDRVYIPNIKLGDKVKIIILKTE